MKPNKHYSVDGEIALIPKEGDNVTVTVGDQSEPMVISRSALPSPGDTASACTPEDPTPKLWRYSESDGWEIAEEWTESRAKAYVRAASFLIVVASGDGSPQ
jgi:hypothetical protein